MAHRRAGPHGRWHAHPPHGRDARDRTRRPGPRGPVGCTGLAPPRYPSGATPPKRTAGDVVGGRGSGRCRNGMVRGAHGAPPPSPLREYLMTVSRLTRRSLCRLLGGAAILPAGLSRATLAAIRPSGASCSYSPTVARTRPSSSDLEDAVWTDPEDGRKRQRHRFVHSTGAPPGVLRPLGPGGHPQRDGGARRDPRSMPADRMTGGTDPMADDWPALIAKTGETTSSPTSCPADRPSPPVTPRS